MTRTLEEWEAVKKQRSYVMPKARLWKRLWGVRHIRAVYRLYRYLVVFRKNNAYTHWLCHGIWLGKEERWR